MYDLHDDIPDLLIVGGGLGGCLAAAAAAGRGLSTVLVEKRPYLGRDIAATNHTFVGWDGTDAALRRCPASFRKLFQIHGGGEIVAPEGLTRQLLIQILAEHGVRVLYEAEPVAASVDGHSLTGLVLACPSGLAWLPGRAIVDATEHANLTRVLAERPHLDAGPARVHAAFELGFSGPVDALVDSPPLSELSAAEQALGLVPGSVRLHVCLRSDNVVVDYAFDAHCSGERAAARSALDCAGRARTVALASWLRENAPAFSGASITHIGYECCIAQAREPGSEAETFANLRVLAPLPWGFSLDDVVSAAASAAGAVADLERAPVPARGAPAGMLVGSGMHVPIADLRFLPCDDDALGVPLLGVELPDSVTPDTVFDADVCVAGIGAGGGMAVLAAAEHGCRVTAIEVNRQLGGTHTAGRVSGYYAGYREGANAVVEQDAARTKAAAIPGARGGGLLHSDYLRRKAVEHGVRLLTGTRVCGVRTDGKRITQVLAANEDGLFAVKAAVTVDATGDADVAAHAGVGYDLGDAHDGMVQSYSMWGTDVYPTPSFLAQRYLTDPGVFHPDVYSERLRAVTVAHRDTSYHHIAPMLTPRESRRIHGEYALTMRDILDGRIFDDVLAVACTQTDSHAFASSDFDRLGGAGGGRPLPVRIPYGCFVPRGIDGLLVAAKAISGERDATCFCRMNADIKNAGYAVGAAAAAAVKAGVGVREIDLGAVQAELRGIGVLPDWAVAAERAETNVTELLDALSTGGFPALVPVLIRSPEEVVGELERRFRTLADSGTEHGEVPFDSECAMLAMGLAWFGSPVGGRRLAALLEQAVNEGRHLTPPHLKAFRLSPLRGGHGHDDFALVNRLLVMAGRSPARESLAPLARLAAETPGLGEPILHDMPYDRNRGDIVCEPFYHRLRNVAYAVERRADASLVPAMEILLASEGVAGHSVPVGSSDVPRYMRAHLEIWLARAAARCGSRVGAQILVRYLTDTHVFFRRHARAELGLLAGTDRGSPEDWQAWIDAQAAWEPVPLRSSQR